MQKTIPSIQKSLWSDIKGNKVTFVFCKLLGYTVEYLYHSFCITIYVFTHLSISNHTYAVNGLDHSFGTKVWTKTDRMDRCGEEVMLVRLCPSHYYEIEIEMVLVSFTTHKIQLKLGFV